MWDHDRSGGTGGGGFWAMTMVAAIGLAFAHMDTVRAVLAAAV